MDIPRAIGHSPSETRLSPVARVDEITPAQSLSDTYTGDGALEGEYLRAGREFAYSQAPSDTGCTLEGTSYCALKPVETYESVAGLAPRIPPAGSFLRVKA